jgi:hypothetical protein
VHDGLVPFGTRCTEYAGPRPPCASAAPHVTVTTERPSSPGLAPAEARTEDGCPGVPTAVPEPVAAFHSTWLPSRSASLRADTVTVYVAPLTAPPNVVDVAVPVCFAPERPGPATVTTYVRTALPPFGRGTASHVTSSWFGVVVSAATVIRPGAAGT